MSDAITPECRAEVLQRMREAYAKACIRQRHLGFSHKEAFCLMRYAPEAEPRETAEFEVLWNSRDGVTPFMIDSRDGKEALKHVQWHLDRRDPEHAPKVGERIFVDLTPEVCIESLERYIEDYWDEMRERFGTRDEALRALTEGLYEGGIPPHVVTVTEDVLVEHGWDDRRPSPQQRGVSDVRGGRRFA